MMGSTISTAKTLLVPAIIALLVFVLATYVFLPLWQRYRNRYSAYLPLEQISNGTQSIRHRVQSSITNWLMPSQWRQRLQDRLVVATDNGSDADYDSDEGEELSEVDENMRSQLEREADRSRSSGRPDLERRLSRDLEEGFMDDSDEELEPAVRAR